MERYFFLSPKVQLNSNFIHVHMPYLRKWTWSNKLDKKLRESEDLDYAKAFI